ncbi:aldo/keto reductase [Photobacterium sp. Hal280]|uniref:aldo/keto reductase n=1 Tax=Photobacterium sp. Hal280 TaxID=3035163 RepID=UPI00301BC978
MNKRQLGFSEIDASVIGLGTWAMGGWMWGGTNEKDAVAAIQESITCGVSLIDTAPAYGLGRSEALVGKAIKGQRDKVVLATKCGLVWHTQKGNHFFDEEGKPVHRYLGRDAIQYELEQSLRRLGTDYIDLYITHWQDPTTPIEETMHTLMDLKQQGKIRAIGVSNISLDELKQYQRFGTVDAVQEKYNMIERDLEQSLLPHTRATGVSCLSYSSLALGLLSGKISAERTFDGDDQRLSNPLFSQPNRQKVQQFCASVAPLAKDYGISVAQLVIAWTLSQPGITYALCGARNPTQAAENARAGEVNLAAADVDTISTLVAQSLSQLQTD